LITCWIYLPSYATGSTSATSRASQVIPAGYLWYTSNRRCRWPVVSFAKGLLASSSAACKLVIHFKGSSHGMQLEPRLRRANTLVPGKGLAEAIDRFQHMRFGSVGRGSSRTRSWIVVQLPKSVGQGAPLVGISGLRNGVRKHEKKQRVLQTCAKVDEDLCAIVSAVIGRENGVQWRAQDFKDVAEVLRVLLEEV